MTIAKADKFPFWFMISFCSLWVGIAIYALISLI